MGPPRRLWWRARGGDFADRCPAPLPAARRTVLPLRPGVPPVARRAATPRPRGPRAVNPRGGAAFGACSGINATIILSGTLTRLRFTKHLWPTARQQAGDGSSVSRGCWRADPDVRQTARTTKPAWRRIGEALPGAPAGRQTEPVLPSPPKGVPPAARWAAARRPRAESVHPLGGAAFGACSGINATIIFSGMLNRLSICTTGCTPRETI